MTVGLIMDRGVWRRRSSGADKYIIRDRDYRVFEAILRKDDVVADVGAHIGTATKRFAAQAGRVVAYEPHPGNFDVLRLNTFDLNNVQRVRSALAAKDGYIDLWLSSSTASHSTRPKRGPGTIRVVAASLPTVLRDGVTALKLDCEGAEYAALEDLARLPDVVRLVTAELHGVTTWGAGPADQLLRSLVRQGFRFVDGPRPAPKTWGACAIFTVVR